MSDTHVQADYLAGRLAFNLWTWTGEANTIVRRDLW